MTLDYAKIVPLLIEAVKELNAKVDALQNSLRND
jgi:outer membrane murein-binding lipoprotein Lpp